MADSDLFSIIVIKKSSLVFGTFGLGEKSHQQAVTWKQKSIFIFQAFSKFVMMFFFRIFQPHSLSKKTKIQRWKLKSRLFFICRPAAGRYLIITHIGWSGNFTKIWQNSHFLTQVNKYKTKPVIFHKNLIVFSLVDTSRQIQD